MSFWPRWVYEDYVDRHAAGREKLELLLSPPAEPFNDQYNNIFVSYDLMPVWMRRNNLITLDIEGKKFTAQNETHFRLVRHAYRADMERYQAEVTSRLGQINSYRTGRAVLGEIAQSGQVLTIVPYHQRNKDDINSLTEYSEGGSDATTHFSPDIFSGPAMLHPGYAPDEALFHELVHASRGMEGVTDFVPVDGSYDDQEEYLAIVLTNIYLSEKGQVSFTGDHLGLATIDFDEAIILLRGNPQRLSMSLITLIENFKNSQPELYDVLAHLPVPPRFNWVRQYDMRRLDYLRMQKGAFTF